MYFIEGFGVLCVIWAVGASDFDDQLYIPHKDKPVSPNDVHKLQKKNKLQTGHDSLELSFPLFPEWDDFPINNLDGKVKDSTKTFQDDKDPFSEMTDIQASKIFKPKKKPKDKFIMTFTEFFIPIMNHKNFDFPSMPKKLDFFEDFFKDFPLKDFDEQPLMRHKTQKRFLDFNPFLSFVRNTSSRISNLFNSNYTNNNATKKTEVKKFGSLFQKPNEALVLMENKLNGTDTIPVCCAGHTACRTRFNKNNTKSNENTWDIVLKPLESREVIKSKQLKITVFYPKSLKSADMHCEQGMCTDQQERENVYISRLKQMANVTKLSRIMIFYTVPILLGIGGIVVATEIIRKHNSAVKQVQFIKQYDPIQHC